MCSVAIAYWCYYYHVSEELPLIIFIFPLTLKRTTQSTSFFRCGQNRSVTEVDSERALRSRDSALTSLLVTDGLLNCNCRSDISMAIGVVISRNLCSLVVSGKALQGEQASFNGVKEHLFSSESYCYSNHRSFLSMSTIKAHSFMGNFHMDCLVCSNRLINKLNIVRRVSLLGQHSECTQTYSSSIFLDNKPHMKNLKKGSSKRLECFFSSDIIDNSQFRPRKMGHHNISDNVHKQLGHRLEIQTHANFQPEDIDTDDSLTSSMDGEITKISNWWENIPKRWTIVLLCFTAFLLCNMDRVNMSIAILPMSSEYNWSPATVGLIQSSFFWGYLLTQILGGIWADKIGGKIVLGLGVIWWSIATVLTPIAAKQGLPFLLVMRAFMGIGEGVAMPAMNNILSKWIPVSERSRSLAFVYSGMYLGSVTGLAFSPMLISKFGWSSVFYVFGSLGSVWFALWQSKAHSSPHEDPELLADEKRLILGGNSPKGLVSSIPWKLILSKPPVWALIISHFCHNWGTFILLTWMPTYYNQVLKFNLTESGLLCVLPWLTMALFANIGGWIADTLVSKGVSITNVRKIMQTIGFLGPAFFLSQLSNVRSPMLAVLCMSCSQGSDAFSQSGLYSNHQDIGPRYAGVLLGLSNTAGVLAGVFGTAATGYILQRGSWDDVFKVSVGLYVVGTLVWNLFSTGEKILD